MKLYWIRHAESLSNISFKNYFIHPILTQKGLIQSLNLGEYFCKNLNKINHVYCSMSLRTILTCLIAVSYYNLLNDNRIKKINTIPHICEKTPYVDKLFNINKLKKIIINNFNKQNNIVNSIKLKKMLNISIKYINANIISLVLKKKIFNMIFSNITDKNDITLIKKINKLNKIDNENLLKKKIINLIKKYNLKNKIEIFKLLNMRIDTNIINYNFNTSMKYNSFIQDDIYNLINKHSNNKTILLFSHKNYLNKIINNNLKLNNCDIIKQNIKYSKKNKIIKNISKHIKIPINNFFSATTLKKNELNHLQYKINNLINLK